MDLTDDERLGDLREPRTRGTRFVAESDSLRPPQRPQDPPKVGGNPSSRQSPARSSLSAGSVERLSERETSQNGPLAPTLVGHDGLVPLPDGRRRDSRTGRTRRWCGSAPRIFPNPARSVAAGGTYMSRYLDLVNERVVVFDGATGTYLQEQSLTADDFGGPDLEGCNEILVVTRPDVIRELHAAYLEVGVDVVETNTFGAFGVPLAEYGIADRAHELNLDGGPARPRGGRGRRPPPGAPASSPGRSARAPSSPPSARSASPSCATPTRCRPRACSRAASTSSSSRPSSTCSGVKAAMNGCRAGHGRGGPAGAAPGPGHHRAHRPHAARHRDRRRARRARRDAARRHRPQLRHRARRDGRAPPPPLPARPHADLVPAQRRAAVGRRRRDALRPHRRAARRVPRPGSSPSSGVGVVGGCCGTTPEHIGQLAEAVRRPGAGAPPAGPRGRRHLDLQPRALRAGHLVPDHRRAHQRQRLEEVPRGPARGRLGHLRRRWPRSRSREGAHVLDVCVDYVGRDGAADMDEIARRFATQVERSRSCSTPPSPR